MVEKNIQRRVKPWGNAWAPYNEKNMRFPGADNIYDNDIAAEHAGGYGL